jgi:hypothetical protein
MEPTTFQQEIADKSGSHLETIGLDFSQSSMKIGSLKPKRV